MRTLRLGAFAVLVLIAISAGATLLAPRALGWTPYVVTSGSMSPTFEPGAVVVASPIEPASVMPGDILTFRAPGGLTTHRVVERAEATNVGSTRLLFTTKGDANEEADPTPLDPRNIVGKAEFAVPRMGYVVEFVKAPLGAGLLAGLFLFLVFSGSSGERPKSGDQGRRVDSRREAASVT